MATSHVAAQVLLDDDVVVGRVRQGEHDEVSGTGSGSRCAAATGRTG